VFHDSNVTVVIRYFARCEVLPPVVIRILLNMYTNQHVRVLWNGVYFKVFSVVNGVKQGGVISPTVCIWMSC